MSDAYIFDKSLGGEGEHSPMIDKEILFLNDQNNGSYQGRIQFDTTVLSNSGRWLDYSQATLEIPFVISAIASTSVTATMNAYVAGLKSGHYHLIDSMQVQYQNKTIIQQQPQSNFFVGYKVMSKWSSDDLEKWGSVCGVSPDSSASMTWANAANARGNGISNNSPYSLAAAKVYTTAVSLEESNVGLRKRLESTAHPVGGYGALPTLTGVAQVNRLGKTHYSESAGAGAAKVYSWKLIATVRLCDYADFFAQVPLLRGAQFRFNIEYNSARVALTTVAAGPTMLQPVAGLTMLSGTTVPAMIMESTANGPSAAWVAAANNTLTIEANVHTTTTPSATASGLLSACRLYVPAYVMSPLAEQEYLSLGTKLIEYDDLYMYKITGSEIGPNVDQILTNGISDAQQLVIIPFVSPIPPSNGATSLQEFQSVFDSAPATTGPLIGLSNLNVLVSGKNIFQQDQDYDFNAFINEVAPGNALCGGQKLGLTSGLLSEKDWSNGYRYYVVDISRRIVASDSVPLSIQVRCSVQSSVIVDLYCFVTYRRQIVVDIATGAVRS